jgi:hypothetical protein
MLHPPVYPRARSSSYNTAALVTLSSTRRLIRYSRKGNDILDAPPAEDAIYLAAKIGIKRPD